MVDDNSLYAVYHPVLYLGRQYLSRAPAKRGSVHIPDALYRAGYHITIGSMKLSFDKQKYRICHELTVEIKFY